MSKKQTGRSMIEMLGVLAIVGVLSIGGIALYRRAVNNHHANTILDDVNRFAFVITEHGGYPEGEDIPKSDFKESGIYQLKGHQAYGSQYSITALNVPKGICEPLVDKGIVDYKVGVVTAGGSVDDEIIYDTLNTDLCQEVNDVAFYFGDTSLVCNPKEDGYTPCTENSDCCGGEFCAFESATSYQDGKGKGTCRNVSSFNPISMVLSNGTTWVRSGSGLSWWSTQNWCMTLGLRPVVENDLNCEIEFIEGERYCTDSTIFSDIHQKVGNGYRLWLQSYYSDGQTVYSSSGKLLNAAKHNSAIRALCH